MNLLSIFLMNPQGGADGKGSGMQTFIMLALIIVVFYFFMIRPQMKRSKEQRKFVENLGKGDKIITTGGIHGKIVELDNATAIIEIEGGARMKVEKSSIVFDPRAPKADAK